MACPVDAAVHQESGSVFFSDHRGHQIMMSDLHCPVTLTPTAGERQPGCRDGKKSLFSEPSGLCVFSNLLFVCDSGNASVRVIDIARLVSRKKSAQEACASESVEEEEDVSTCQTPLIRPFSICRGRKIMQDYHDIYVGDTKQGRVFKITDVKVTSQCSGRLRKLYPAASTNRGIVPVALVFHEDRLFIANGDTNEHEIVVIHANGGTLLSTIASPLISSNSGMCLTDKCLFVSCENHTILKISHIDTNVAVEHYSGKANEPGTRMGLCHLRGFTLPTALLAWDLLCSFAIAGIGPFDW